MDGGWFKGMRVGNSGPDEKIEATKFNGIESVKAGVSR